MKTRDKYISVLFWMFFISMVLPMMAFSLTGTVTAEAGYRGIYSDNPLSMGEVEFVESNLTGTCNQVNLHFMYQENPIVPPPDFIFPADMTACVGDVIRLPHIDSEEWALKGFTTNGWGGLVSREVMIYLKFLLMQVRISM